jgi:hypothetical protein
MRVALRGSYVEYVVYMGLTERYPMWFAEELYDATFTDESNFTFWVPMDERKPDYYEKQLIADYSVFLRKPDGEIHVTDFDIFRELYVEFTYNAFTNSGIAALQDDCIEYVECKAGALPSGYPHWFYDFFTEALNYPHNEETMFFYDADERTLTASRDSIKVTAGGEVMVTEHSVFLYNKYGEIRGMRYDEFLKCYDPEPKLGEDSQ